MNALTSFQRDVLTAVQAPLPICERPFERLAAELHTTEQILLDEIRILKADGLIRRYRPQIRYRALGRTAVLAAAAVPQPRLEQTAAAVSALAGVSHNYQRNGRLNLWFTLQGRSLENIESDLERLGRSTGQTFYSFPTESVYKLDVRFNPGGPGAEWFTPAEYIPPVPVAEQAVLTAEEKEALEAIQCEVPIVPRPFDEILSTAGGISAVSILQSLSDKGVLNKIAAVLDYNRLGYTANTMFCAVVAGGRCDAVGRELARIPAVTHCYRRRTYPDWPYTLYAMLHADRIDRIEGFVRDFCAARGIENYAVLPTVREFKKSPVRFVE